MPYFLAPIWKTDISKLSEDELWTHFERCLDSHDWYYQYSDDHGVWRAGQEQSEHLRRVYDKLKAIDENRATRLYRSKSPFTKTDEDSKQ